MNDRPQNYEDGPPVGYALAADMRAKKGGNSLKEALMTISGKDGWDKEAFANAVILDSLEFLPFGDGLNRLSDEAIREAIPKIEAMLSLAVALTRQMSAR